MRGLYRRMVKDAGLGWQITGVAVLVVLVALLGWGVSRVLNDRADAAARNDAVTARANEAENLTGGLVVVNRHSYQWSEGGLIDSMRVTITLGKCNSVPGIFYTPRHPASWQRVSHLYVVDSPGSTQLVAVANDLNSFTRNIAHSRYLNCLP